MVSFGGGTSIGGGTSSDGGGVGAGSVRCWVGDGGVGVGGTLGGGGGVGGLVVGLGLDGVEECL